MLYYFVEIVKNDFMGKVKDMMKERVIFIKG